MYEFLIFTFSQVLSPLRAGRTTFFFPTTDRRSVEHTDQEPTPEPGQPHQNNGPAPPVHCSCGIPCFRTSPPGGVSFHRSICSLAGEGRHVYFCRGWSKKTNLARLIPHPIKELNSYTAGEGRHLYFGRGWGKQKTNLARLIPHQPKN